jgi:hypothetical protein
VPTAPSAIAPTTALTIITAFIAPAPNFDGNTGSAVDNVIVVSANITRVVVVRGGGVGIDRAAVDVDVRVVRSSAVLIVGSTLAAVVSVDRAFVVAGVDECDSDIDVDCDVDVEAVDVVSIGVLR